MSNVSVDSRSVRGGINCCKMSVEKLRTSVQVLQQKYQAAGSGGWQDTKYRELGGIVNECSKAMGEPLKGLDECMLKLRQLLAAVEKYEKMNLR